MANWFQSLFQASASTDELPDIFPLQIAKTEFVQTDVINIYAKILTDVMERSHGLSDDLQALLWDNCLQSESSDGLITMIAKAMTDKKDLFLIYDSGLKLVRKATNDEEGLIRDDYKKQGQSKIGVYVSFKNYSRSDMVKLYSALEYCTVAALNKEVNLSAALQIKMKDLRGSTALTDKAEVKEQALAIARGLSNGKDVLLDAGDIIETSDPSLEPVKQGIEFLNQKRAFYLGMPASYINGELVGGLNNDGSTDTKAVERGLKNYYYSIVKPVMKALFNVELTYKSQDFRMIDQGLNALQAFSLVDEELMNAEQKKRIINQLFDFAEAGSET